jgi:plasmid stabilization system protein ParE
MSGRVVPEDPYGELREIIVSPYRVIYEIKTDVIEIKSVRHGAQNLSDLREP